MPVAVVPNEEPTMTTVAPGDRASLRPPLLTWADRGIDSACVTVAASVNVPVSTSVPGFLSST